ncbi:MAG: fatty acyl-AMP ligase [Cyanobacteria bacterium J06621_11]
MASPVPSQDNSPNQLDHCHSLVEILRYRAQHQPNQVAYISLENGETESGRLTYAQLDAQARAIATQLQTLGASGQCILLSFPLSDGLSFTAAFMGCLYAGSIALTAWPPLNESLLSELQYKAVDAEVQFALTTNTLLAQNKESFTTAPPLDQIHWIPTDTLNSNTAENWEPSKITPSTLAYLQYTSGSTGLPKGAMITHGNVLNNLNLIYNTCQYTTKDIGICWLPLYHDLGLVGAVIQPIYAGGPVVMMSPVDFILKPIRWLQAISRYRGTTSGGPNFAYDLCTRKVTPDQIAQLDLSSWAIAVNGAEPVLASTLNNFAKTFAPTGFRKSAFSPAYGMAETTVMISMSGRDTAPIVKTIQRSALEQNLVRLADNNSNTENRIVVGCGQLVENHPIAIVNPDNLKRCNEEEIGEIWVAGGSVAKGYYNRKEQTEETFQAYINRTEVQTGSQTKNQTGTEIKAGPFLRTGDMGFIQNNELFITGRLKDIIILWGNNHYPHFLEATVEQSHPALRPGGVAAFGIPVGDEERLVIVQEIESRSLKNLNPEEIIGAIRLSLGMQHMLEPHAIALLRPGSTPKTPTGKTQRRACKTKYLAGELNIIAQWQHEDIAEGILLNSDMVNP